VGGRLRRVLRDTPLVLLIHHLRCSEPVPWPVRAAALPVEWAAARSASLVICTSETTARTVRPFARRGVPIEAVRPGWDTHGGAGGKAGGQAGGFGADDHGAFRLLLVGHWTPRKGIVEALAALARVRTSVTLDL